MQILHDSGRNYFEDVMRKKVPEAPNPRQPIRQFNAGWLESFLKVAETKHFTQASEALGWHRSNVKRDVMALEKWLGRVLFYDHVSLRLTDDGKIFQSDAVKMLDLLKQSRAPIRTPAK
ncbi:LysR family transcriptional regulator [Sphingobium sp. PNB]|uniref:LysR family transcriptional regulator n=1 Tax=Sphingobium sp. PNB TaxID=863934 RepID=UPI001CA3A438|nr:LysR family transcriptional regulator [Sphingobium sp. PNB]MCB4862727.1 LysR family transcriptional regulator [Sphingobium sp. PNB]